MSLKARFEKVLDGLLPLHGWKFVKAKPSQIPDPILKKEAYQDWVNSEQECSTSKH